MTCTECDRPALAKGLCSLHYQRARRAAERGTSELRPSRWHPVDRTCSVDGCGKPRINRGYCSMHFERWKRWGDPLRLVRPSGIPVLDRFWSKVLMNGSIPAHAPELGPCWPWAAGTTSDGYGCFGIDSTHIVLAHRFAWETWRMEPITPGLTIDHLCFNVLCCNPSHMEPVTNSENLRRLWLRRKSR